MYLLLKHLHLTFIALALLTFVIRGVWLFTQSGLLTKKWVKITPHIINTMMLLSGIALAGYLQLSPHNEPWLLAKIIALCLFIPLGVAAFKLPNPLMRKILWFDALIVFGYIISVAITKSPWGVFA
jgi:uncharacterized membrane protein SirB2